MTAYPSFSDLKKLYPDVGFDIYKREDNQVFAFQTLKGKKLSSVYFKGFTDDEVFSNILKLWHWEKTRKKLPVPFDIPALSKVDVAENKPAEVKAPDRKGLNFVGTKWIKEIATGNKTRLPKAQAEEAVASGKFIFSGPRS